MMRNSREFPKWLNAPETKEKLKGKKVMMYCTGGIDANAPPRYSTQTSAPRTSSRRRESTTFAEASTDTSRRSQREGTGRGRNYLFDLRGEQKAEEKADDVVDDETNRHCGDSYCCVCKEHWALYKGKHVCSNKECKVPVIVCDGCRKRAETELKSALLCQLCERGHVLRDLPLPDLVGQKRKLALGKRWRHHRREKKVAKRDMEPARWVHVARLPLIITASEVRLALAGVTPGKGAPAGVSTANGGGRVEWIPDRDTGFFYGSCYVEFPSTEDAERAVKRAMDAPPKLGNRCARVNFAPARAKDPARAGNAGERPPVPIAPGA